ncbi:MAG: metallophosphoesterase [Glaciihabitans sp.]|nr:metallophosphoesterase [Glaciihabitans sp.]
MSPSFAKTSATTLGVAALAGGAAVAYGALVERNRFTVRHETLPILDEGARSLTVLHISDMHLAPWQTAKQEWIRSLRIFEPDLIVNTGDNMGHADALASVKHVLEPFAGIPGVYVNGSNDYFGPIAKNPLAYFGGPSSHSPKQTKLDVDAMEDHFNNKFGWLNLNNTARAMTIRGSRLEFFGVNDAHRKWDRLDLLPGAIDDERENVAWGNTPGSEVISIGLTHAPYRRVLDAFVTYGAAAVFAGHTHGGQVRLPKTPALVTNCDIPRDQASGLSHWEHAQKSAYLNVSAGLGTSIYAPFRFACPPEAVVVTLTARDFSYS